jgi:hypothetical protein
VAWIRRPLSARGYSIITRRCGRLSNTAVATAGAAVDRERAGDALSPFIKRASPFKISGNITPPLTLKFIGAKS